MGNSFKLTILLSEIEPGNNPRKDFGDIDALAATIEATGGQPVNPLIVVRDGNKFRLVDGERRYRAMVKLHGKDGMVDALCFGDYDEAQEAVAMIATDDKMQLSEAERAQGFQQMMLLGVESRTIAKAMHRKTADIAAARAVAKEAPAQATIDQMICAAQFDSEEDRAAVLAADPTCYEAKAEAIKRNRKEEHDAKELYDCIIGLGFDPEETRPDGYDSIMWASTAKEMERLVSEHENEELAVWPVPWNKRFYYLGRKHESKETPERRAEREREDRISAAFKSLRKELIREVATRNTFPEMQEVAGRLRTDANGYNYERDQTRSYLKEIMVGKTAIDGHLAAPASMWETLEAMCSTRLGRAKWTVTWLPPALKEGGYFESPEDLWLLEQAKEELEREADE